MFAYGLFQNEVMVASAEASDRREAMREIARYALQYSEDGPVHIKPIDPTPDGGMSDD